MIHIVNEQYITKEQREFILTRLSEISKEFPEETIIVEYSEGQWKVSASDALLYRLNVLDNTMDK